MSEQKKTPLTPEEQELKERLMRSGPPPVRKGTGKVSEEFWNLPKPTEDKEWLFARGSRGSTRRSRKRALKSIEVLGQLCVAASVL